MPGDQYSGKTIKGTAVLNRVVRRERPHQDSDIWERKGKVQREKHALKNPLSPQNKFLTLNIAFGPGIRMAAWLRS